MSGTAAAVSAGESSGPDSSDFEFDDGMEGPAAEDIGDAPASDIGEPDDSGEAGGEPDEQTSVADTGDDADGAAAIEADLIEEARQIGLSDEDVGAFQSSAQLRRTLDLIHRTAGRKAGEPVKPDGQKPPDAQQPTAAERLEFEKLLDPDMLAPELLEYHRKVNDHFDGKLKKIEEHMQLVLGHLANQEAEAFFERADGWFDQLGPAYHDLVGKGAAGSLSGEPLKKRRAVIEQMDTLAAGYKARGLGVPKEKQLFDMAARIELGERQQTIARREITQKLDRRKGQMLTRQTQRVAGKHQSPEQKAIANANARLRAAGMDDDGA